MIELKEYLKSEVEMSEETIEQVIGAHIKVLDKMEKKNQKKNKAAMNEDFELAAKYKNQIIALKNQLLKYDDVLSLMKQKPELTLRQLLELTLELDQTLHFTKNLTSNLSLTNLTKDEIISKLM